MRRYLLILFTLILLFPQTIFANDKSVNGYAYAPFLFYENYHYKGSGSEFAGYDVQIEYPLNEEGVYQFKLIGSGTTISYVYQLTDDGIVELSYFPESYNKVDYRKHKDSLDPYTSLILPKELKPGLEFSSGYNEEQKYRVVDILDKYTLGEDVFENVVVLFLDQQDPQVEQYFYYAPKVGLIYDEFKFTDTTLMNVTSWLEKATQEKNYQHLTFNFDLLEEGEDE